MLHSQIMGEGEPLVILHGFLGMGDNWKTLGNRFAADGYQVHLVDQRNHGRSFHSPEFNYGVMATDLLTYLDHYGLGRIMLLGHSMGGKTAMEFAVQHPERVEKLIVADIAPKEYPSHHQDILKALSSLDFDQIKSRGEADKALAQYLKEPGVRQFLLKNLYWVEKGKLGLRINLPVLTQYAGQVGEALDQNSMYTGPTLFLRGGRSSYILEIDEMGIGHHFADYELDTINDAGHWLHAEKPDEFYRIVTKFL
ncbi:alpha/beta hydrolase [Aureitalea marina]|uniref:Alpha/beta hydrolase n=1 Tax=Aureitalea marina TaxID=930804 RepID=A0A2S7KTV9_9FLAO|nr:alpha/beta hydrolase [Aureitalea marina]